jgi:hypothetical protein
VVRIIKERFYKMNAKNMTITAVVAVLAFCMVAFLFYKELTKESSPALTPPANTARVAGKRAVAQLQDAVSMPSTYPVNAKVTAPANNIPTVAAIEADMNRRKSNLKEVEGAISNLEEAKKARVMTLTEAESQPARSIPEGAAEMSGMEAVTETAGAQSAAVAGTVGAGGSKSSSSGTGGASGTQTASAGTGETSGSQSASAGTSGSGTSGGPSEPGTVSGTPGTVSGTPGIVSGTSGTGSGSTGSGTSQGGTTVSAPGNEDNGSTQGESGRTRYGDVIPY